MLHGSEGWTMKSSKLQNIQSAEMNFLRAPRHNKLLDKKEAKV